MFRPNSPISSGILLAIATLIGCQSAPPQPAAQLPEPTRSGVFITVEATESVATPTLRPSTTPTVTPTLTPGPTQTPPATPTVIPSPTSNALIVSEAVTVTEFQYTLPQERFAINVPNGWEVADLSGNVPPNDSPAMVELRASGFLDELYESNVRFYAFEPSTGTNSANLILIHETVDEPIDLPLMIDRLVAQAGFNGSEEQEVSASTERVNGQERGVVMFQTEVSDPDGNRFTLQTIQTILVDETTSDVWILSVNYDAGLSGGSLAMIDLIIESLTILALE